MDESIEKFRGFWSYFGEGLFWFFVFLGIGFGAGSCSYLMQSDARKPLIVIEIKKS